jgi:LysR family transcriptional regulator (chromosome initiation inhibitor)
MLDYPSLRAVAAVAQTGSFEKAARLLNVTPSAISQRVRQFEDRLGAVLISRGTPCVATEKGAWLCRHIEHVALLEKQLFSQMPDLADPDAAREKTTIRIATNADSLASWFLPAVSGFAQSADCLLNVAVDDQDHTADWLRRGEVIAAVTSLEKPVQGCRRIALGALRYRATASPAFFDRHFSRGVTREAIATAPALTFNQKDSLQDRWISERLGFEVSYPTHWLPSSQSFVEANLLGLGWGMNPEILVTEHLRAGRLVEIAPDAVLDIALFWQINRFAGDQLAPLTRDIVQAAASALVGPA